MRVERRDSDRPRRHGAALLHGAVAAVLLAACGAPGGDRTPWIDPHVRLTLGPVEGSEAAPVDLRPSVETFRDYVDALAGFDSADPAVWDASARRLRALPAGTVTDEERRLVDQAVTPPGGPARAALVRTAQMYRRVAMVFLGEYVPSAWDSAFRDIQSMGPHAVEYLVDTLWLQLLQPARELVWDYLRATIVRAGEPGIRHTADLLDACVLQATAAESVEGFSFNPVENEMTRCYEVLLQAGDAGRARIEAALAHPHPNVRKPLASAVANLRAGDRLDVLERLRTDRDWQVRAGAVEALGKLDMAADRALPLLTESMRDEEPIVRREAIRAMLSLPVPADRVGPALLQALQDSEAGARDAAVTGPAEERAGRVREFVEVRNAAISALGAVGYAPALPVLERIVVLGNRSADVRAGVLAAVEAIGRLHAPEAVDFLIGLLDARVTERYAQGTQTREVDRPDTPMINSAIAALQETVGLRIFSIRGWKEWHASRAPGGNAGDRPPRR